VSGWVAATTPTRTLLLAERRAKCLLRRESSCV